MTVYRGEGGFDVFNSVVLDENKKYTLKNALEKITSEIENGQISQNEINEFIKAFMLKRNVTQERFMSTAIDSDAIEDYAKKFIGK